MPDGATLGIEGMGDYYQVDSGVNSEGHDDNNDAALRLAVREIDVHSRSRRWERMIQGWTDTP
jgi:hypothetical protein